MRGVSKPVMIKTCQFVVFLLVAAASMSRNAKADTATVLSVGDGDTLRIRQASMVFTVRLACIDAPETSQSPWGAAARRELQGLLPIGRAVAVRRKATDRYGRTVAEVFSGGRNINQALVGSGAAFVYWQYIAGCDRNVYSRVENQARLQSLGVWSVPGGINRPWDYRRKRRPGPSVPRAGGSVQHSAPSGGTRFTCRQIGSWSQAQALLRQGHSYLDGDGDGEACESLRR